MTLYRFLAVIWNSEYEVHFRFSAISNTFKEIEKQTLFRSSEFSEASTMFGSTVNPSICTNCCSNSSRCFFRFFFNFFFLFFDIASSTCRNQDFDILYCFYGRNKTINSRSNPSINKNNTSHSKGIILFQKNILF